MRIPNDSLIEAFLKYAVPVDVPEVFERARIGVPDI